MNANLPPSPYPGLRAFRPEESLIFCGRGEQRAEVLDLLGDARFLAVVGASGSGKSSLVLAGLVPDIRDGQLIGVDADTVRIVTIQPGLSPFAHLSSAIATEFAADVSVEPILRRGPLGLVQFLDEVEHEAERALIVIVDQFEEIFRFADMTDADLNSEEAGASNRLLDGTENEAQAFVNLLLETSRQARHHVYVLLTMRSDFLPRCDQFTGLPEAISRSQFLTPRLKRAELELTITRPLAYYGAQLQPELVNLILNQISTEQDQLPRMEHTLARMWERRTIPPDGGVVTLTIADYNAVGGLAAALNNHGDSLCAELAQKSPLIDLAAVERFFRAMAHHVSANVPPVRRPVRLSQIVAETGLPLEVVRQIADAFRAEGTHLLMPPVTRIAELKADNFVDISHESLLRQWRRLKGWLDKEWQQRRMAGELVTAMEDWSKEMDRPSKRAFAKFFDWKDAGQAIATRLHRDAEPVFFSKKAPATLPAWAKRYGIDWQRLAGFCEKAFQWKKMTAVLSKAGLGLAVLSGLLIYALIFAVYKSNQAANALAEEKVAKGKAQAAEAKATSALYDAKLAKEIAEARYQDALNSAVDERNNSTSQSEALQKLIAATETLSSTPASVAQAQKQIAQVLSSEALQGFAPISAAPDAGPETPPTAGEHAATFQKAQVFNVDYLETIGGPKVAFLDHRDGLMLIVGGSNSRTTLLWNLSGENGDEFVFPFESRRLRSSADYKTVTSITPPLERVISGPGVSKEPAKNSKDSPARLVVHVGGKNEYRISPPSSEKPGASIFLQADRQSASFSRDYTMLATSDIEGRVYLWDVRFAPEKIPPPVILLGHKKAVSALRWAPGDNYLVTGGEDGVPIVWQSPAARLNSGANALPYILPNHPGGVTDIAISPDGKRVATTGADRGVRVFPIAPTIRGTAREWGGPNDQHGKGGDLALLSPNDVTSDVFKPYFLPTQPPGTTGMITRLNPETFYANARWDYSITPRSVLRRTKVRIRKLTADGKASEIFVDAQAVDWGPPAFTGFACDVSPAVIKTLNLSATDKVELEVLLLEARQGNEPRAKK